MGGAGGDGPGPSTRVSRGRLAAVAGAIPPGWTSQNLDVAVSPRFATAMVEKVGKSTAGPAGVRPASALMRRPAGAAPCPSATATSCRRSPGRPHEVDGCGRAAYYDLLPGQEREEGNAMADRQVSLLRCRHF